MKKMILIVVWCIIGLAALVVVFVLPNMHQSQMQWARDAMRISDTKFLSTALVNYYADTAQYPEWEWRDDFQEKMWIYIGFSYPANRKNDMQEMICYDDLGITLDATCNTLYGVGDNEDAPYSLYKLAVNFESRKYVQPGEIAQSDGGNILGRYEIFSDGGEEVEAIYSVIE